MTTAEKYRQLEQSPAIKVARFIFNELKKTSTNTTLNTVIKDIKTGKTPSKANKKYYEDDFLNWFKPNEIGSNKFLIDSKEKLSKFAFESNQATIYDPNTLLINSIGDIGRLSIITKKSSSNQQITGITFNENIDVEYAYYYLLAHREYFYIDLFQTTLPIVNQKKINSIPFVYPSLEEQKKIVKGIIEIENIKTVNELDVIENLEWNNDQKSICKIFFNIQFNTKNISSELFHQLSLIKQLRQAFLREAMQGLLVKTETNGETGAQLLEKIKAEKAQLIKEKKLKKEKELPPISEEEIPFEIPEHWEWCRLGEVCTKITDGFHNTPPKVSNGFPYIAATHVKEEKIDWDNCQFVEEKYHRELYSKAYPKKGELLVVNIGAGCGTSAIIDVDYEFSFKNTAILKFNLNLLLNKLINYFFIWKKEEIYNQLTKGGLQPFLSLTILNNIIIPLPPVHEQQQIVSKLDELMAFCDGLEESIKESQGMNEKLLQEVLREALQGEVV